MTDLAKAIAAPAEQHAAVTHFAAAEAGDQLKRMAALEARFDGPIPEPYLKALRNLYGEAFGCALAAREVAREPRADLRFAQPDKIRATMAETAAGSRRVRAYCDAIEALLAEAEATLAGAGE